MRILVTGGAGFIGSHLVDAFLQRGDDVAVLDNLSTGRRENLAPAATLYEHDIRDRAAVLRTFAAHTPEVVLHLAAQADVRRSMDDPEFDASVNLIGTTHLLDGARSAHTRRFVFASTGGAVYGEPQSIPVPETEPTRPACCYGASKRAAELYLGVYALEYGLNTTVLRYANVYGPRQNPKGEAGVVAIFSLLALEGRTPTIFGDGTKTRDYVYVEDIVRANLLAVEAGADGTFNIGTGQQTTDFEVFAAVRDAAGANIEPSYSAKRKGEIDHIALDASLAMKTFGWTPQVDFKEGVRRSVDYYRTHLAKAGS